jgi:hypothetical protein
MAPDARRCAEAASTPSPAINPKSLPVGDPDQTWQFTTFLV